MGVPLNVTEWMKGYVGFGRTDSDAGFIHGLEHDTRFAHEVVIRIDDIDRFVEEPTHAAVMDGHIECARLGGRRPVVGGTFNMLVDAQHPGLKLMFYRLPFEGADGARYTMLGHKTIRDDRSLDLWSDITTLSMRIFEGDVAGPEVSTAALGPANMPDTSLAAGVLHIEALDGFRSARSFQSPGSSSLQAAAAALKFGRFYLDRLWDIFGKTHNVST